MCGPVLPIMMLAGSVLQGVSQMSQANSQAAAMRQQARNVKTMAELNSEQIRRRAAIVRGRQEAMAGASGMDLSSFSSLDDILQDTAKSEAADVFNTMTNAQMQADNINASAANIKSQGQSALIGSVFKGISGIAGSGFLDSIFAGGSAAGPAGMYSGGTGTNPMTGLRFGGV